MTKLLGAAPAADDDAVTKGFVDDKIGASTNVNTATEGQIPIADGAGDAAWADPFVQGVIAHDSPIGTTKPVVVGGYAIDFESMPTAVAPDDVVRAAYTPKGIAAVALFDPETETPLTAVPVTVQNEVTVSGTVTANAGTNLNTSALATEEGGNLAAAAASLGIMDDWDEADRAKVNLIAGQAGVQGGAGVVTALTQRMALATDANKIKLTDGTLDLTLVDETGAAAVDALPVGGGTPHDAVDSGNPVKIGGVASSAVPTAVTAGDRTNAWYNLNAAAAVFGVLATGSSADGVDQISRNARAGASWAPTGAGAYIFNGTNWDRARGDTTNGVDVDVTRLPLPTLATTGTVTSQADQATNATLLSANAARKGFRIFNDSTVVLYVKYGATATTTDFTAALQPGAYLEENHYSGRVDGIWASNASGSARITELT